MAKTVLGGSTPILYTIDCKYIELHAQLVSNLNSTGYLASYLIVKQLSHRHKHAGSKEEEEEDGSNSSIASKCDNRSYHHGDEERATKDDINSYHNKARDTYYQSIDGTLVASTTAASTPHHSYLEGDDGKIHPVPSLPPFEKKIYDFTRKNSATKLLEDNDTTIEILVVRDKSPESPKLAIPRAQDEK